MDEKIKQQIQNDIDTNKVMLYMKGTPQFPQCGFSNAVCEILNSYGIEYGSCNVLANDAIRQGIKDFSDWPTIPQLYINGEFVGGCDITMEMHASGELKNLLGVA